MEARALAKQVRISPYKVRRILPLIRGKKVDEAMMILKYSPQKAAGIVSKVLQSAVANAEHNYGMYTDKLRVVKATADQGTRMKRLHPVSMGRGHPYQHRTSHVTIEVTRC